MSSFFRFLCWGSATVLCAGSKPSPFITNHRILTALKLQRKQPLLPDLQPMDLLLPIPIHRLRSSLQLLPRILQQRHIRCRWCRQLRVHLKHRRSQARQEDRKLPIRPREMAKELVPSCNPIRCRPSPHRWLHSHLPSQPSRHANRSTRNTKPQRLYDSL